MNRNAINSNLLILLLMMIVCSCAEDQKSFDYKPIIVDFSNQMNEKKIDNSGINLKPVEVAIAAMTSPNETYKYYHELIQYFSLKLKRQIHIIQRKTYAEINSLITQDKVDLAFICSGAYITALEENLPLEILTIPIINNKAYYHAYIIVNTESRISTFNDLKGKSFAFTDPLSNTGFLYGKALIKDCNESVDKFFTKTMFTYGHDYSIQAVERKIVDGATVNSLIFDYIKKKYPERVSHIKIINVSEPFGIPPVVVRKNLDNNLKIQFRNLFLNLQLDTLGSEILKKLMIDRYNIPDSTDYSSILQKSRFVGK
ncbi:MAG: phosphate/phosphite/phosphonate ABC transporter substrate-binding protein [Candidatus Kapabacteria bacterium]|nr:phosphate/phosphite/phosphonate ABC transporter substrate-binding protein [Candidatus Kapabacteria bacterium]